MARLLPEEMKGKKLIPLCLATKPNEAKQIESILDGATVDYTFEIKPLQHKSIFSVLLTSVKNGVVFLVSSDQYEYCISVLENAGLEHLIID